YNLSANAAWELVIWGRVRRQVVGSEAQLQASAADLEGVELSLISTFLQTYFQYQLSLELLELYAQTIDIYEHTLSITESRYAAGMVARSDVDSAISQLESARVQEQNALRQREQLEHALAVLLGEAPSVREFVAQPREFDYPEMPVTV